jgi:hypothetical protein
MRPTSQLLRESPTGIVGNERISAALSPVRYDRRNG